MIETYRFPFADTPEFMLTAAKKYEEKFNIEFATLAWFPQSLLASLQKQAGDNEIPSESTIASRNLPSMAEDINTLSLVANSATLDTSLRLKYRTSIENVFRVLPRQPQDLTVKPDVLSVAPAREGALLASHLGYLNSESLTPEAKRIHCNHGLVIGLTALSVTASYSECVLIDGAIATGTTLISLISELRHNAASFKVYAAHSTLAGLWALANYARDAAIKLSCTVGHVSGVLNDEYYAVHPSGRLVIGDVGDTIAPLPWGQS
jgi:hypothetical protein